MNRLYTNNRLSPKQIIVIYSDKERNNFYLEQRELKEVQGKLSMMAAVPMSDDVMRDLAKSYMRTNSMEMKFQPLVGSHMLYAENKPGKTIVIWYRPAMTQTLNFSEGRGLKSGSIAKIPATLYMVHNNNLYLFALMTDERPDLKTKLYKAPYFNIYEDGRVCLGTAKVGKIKAKTFEAEAERYERGFWLAEQSGGHSTQNCKTPLTTLWPRLIKSKAAFPSKLELVQHGKYKTLGTLISKITGNDGYND